ncbi:MAG: hypothetical protein FJW69_01795 [Actinobacteria bacterium]|nr:hypothetical protein [Actinomycetota bacterium]
MIRRKFSFILIFMVIISVLLFSSCRLFDNYFVKRQDFDVLKEEYNKIAQDYKKQSEELKSLSGENEELKNEYDELEKETARMEKEISAKNEEISTLTEKLEPANIKNLEEQIKILQEEPEKLKKILNDMNDLLKYTYIGSASPDELAYTFTAFSIAYKGKFYIITAGHCVQDNYGKEGTFKFKANFSDEWISPELLGYKAEFYNLDDYGVFYSDKVTGGLTVSDVETPDYYLLGSLDKRLSVFRNLGDSSRRGESGSPVINENGQVVGIYVVYGLVYTPIQLALDVIDSSVIN